MQFLQKSQRHNGWPWRLASATVALLLLLNYSGGCQADNTQSRSFEDNGAVHPNPGNQETPRRFHQVAQAARALIYEPDFPGIARTIIGRQNDNTRKELKNNVPGHGDVSLGTTDYWKFPSSELHGSGTNETAIIPPMQKRGSEGIGIGGHPELRRRDTEPWLHITLSVCSQPSPTDTKVNVPPPQLELLISWTNPAPGQGPNAQPSPVPITEGFGRYDNPMSDDLFIAVQAPSSSDYSGSYSYELAGSIDTPYADYQDHTFLHVLDSDAGAGLLITSNLTDSADPDLTEKWKNVGPRFNVFAHSANDTQFAGLRHSYCGLKKNAQIGGLASKPADPDKSSLETGLTTLGGGAAKQQFYVGGLNKSSEYLAILGLDTNYSSAGSGHPGGGGTVWKHINFTTKNEDNCQLVHNLTFCTNVNYAVPSRPNLSHTELGQLYDDNTRSMYTNFSYSMQQIPCNTSSDSKYSLAVTCDNCTAAYKQWLCAVSLPRCMDYASHASYLQVRNVAQDFVNGTLVSTISSDPSFNATSQMVMAVNSSRNPWIDANVQPGPYKELLPCENLCYNLVQSCPSALGFACPYVGKGLYQSYGRASMDGIFPTCNMPGAIWGISTGKSLRPSVLAVAVVALSITLGT